MRTKVTALMALAVSLLSCSPDGADRQSPAAPSPIPIVVDTDAGLDDAIALLYLAGGEDAIPVTGPVRDVQTTGAGDVFMVAYIASRSDGEEPAAAANQAAEIVARMLEQRKQFRG